MCHAKRVDWHVMLITIEHASLLLLRETLIENLLRVVHLLLVVHRHSLLFVMDEVLSTRERVGAECGSRAWLANLSTCSWLVQIVTHVFSIQREECLRCKDLTKNLIFILMIARVN